LFRVLGEVTSAYGPNPPLFQIFRRTDLTRAIKGNHRGRSRNSCGLKFLAIDAAESSCHHVAVLIGIISIGDLVKNIIDDQKFTIDQLTHFISS
jgi:hypothetical protein